MNLSKNIAQHLRAVYTGGNWTCSDLSEHLADITWQQATHKVQGFNTIAALLYHIAYYTKVGLCVLRNEPIKANDKYSFAHPPINDAADWQQLIDQTLAEAEALAQLIEQLPDAQMGETFFAEQYGSYYHNLNGIIEHAHYHLGQIVWLKKRIAIEQEQA